MPIPLPSRRALTELVLIVIAFFVYFGVRGLVIERVAEAEANAESLIALEKSLGIYWEARLQELVMVDDWIRRIANGVYLYAHGPVIAIVAVLLYTRNRRNYLLTRNTILISGAIGLVIYTSFPVAPPRLVPDGPFIDTVLEEYNVRRVLMPNFLTNEYAAVPSLHFGWNLVMGVAIWKTFANLPARVFAVAMPIAMLTAIVVTGNHFFLDAAAGLAVVIVGALIAYRVRVYAQRRFDGDGAGHDSLRWLLGALKHPERPVPRAAEPEREPSLTT